MNRIGDRRFLFAWQGIRAASQPDSEATTWRIAGVRWCRHRYSHAAPDHAVTVEVHRLDHDDVRDRWSILVVAEHWWDERHRPLRNHLWATHLAGSRESVAGWFDRQAKLLDKSGFDDRDI